ncbi:excalibur calcium-binding domain-containing protein [Aestuariibius insulae]|uniref:excalibur calcium-binding domain-containing protein n=1 Tax=Aestuariibius insulae TaxID=2058287 RepID=UPI00345E5975
MTATETPKPRPTRRQRRADRERAKVLSLHFILTRILLLPLVVLSISLSIYIRTSPFPMQVTIAHLMSMSGCRMTQHLGLAPAVKGAPGYHARNDANGNGVACETGVFVDTAQPAGSQSTRSVSGAKFVRP